MGRKPVSFSPVNVFSSMQQEESVNGNGLMFDHIVFQSSIWYTFSNIGANAIIFIKTVG